MTDEIRHAAKLPFGYRVEFKWRNGETFIEWDPDVPVIHSERAWRKFRKAYNAERRIFYTAVTTVVGGPTMVVDLDGLYEVIESATKH